MTAAEIVDGLLRMNLAAGAGILGVVALRKMARTRFGARLAYGLWLLPVLSSAAAMIPARQIVIIKPAAAPVITAAARVHQTFAAPMPAPAPALAPVAAMSLDPLVLLVGLWLAGAAGAALVMAGLQRRFMRQARIGGVGPAVVGVIAPRIVTPQDFAQRYSLQEQALVLAHEQAHIARQDSRLNALSAAAQCLCWFNPLVHLGAHLMRMDQELACDEAVVSRFPGARRAYAEVLMKAQLAVLPLPLGCYWPSKTQHPLVERVAMLKRKDIGRGRRMAGGVALAALCASAGVAAWAAQPAEVRTVFKAAPVGQAPDGAKGKDGDASSTAFPMRADQSFHDEAHHVDIFKGHVIFNGYLKAAPSWRLSSDLMVLPSGPSDEPGVPHAEKATWEGRVVVNHGDDAARADYAYYDFDKKTLTLTGHVAVDKGPWVAKNDRLVIHAKDFWRVGGVSSATSDAQPADAVRTVPDTAITATTAPNKVADSGIVIQHVVIHGAGRIGESQVRSILGIVPGQTATPATLKAALQRLDNVGLFTGIHSGLKNSGDLDVWVTEKPAAKLLIEASPEPRPILQAVQPVWKNVAPGFMVKANRFQQSTDGSLTTWAGDVILAFGEDHMNADQLEIQTDPAAGPAAGELRGFQALGSVVYTVTGGRVEAGGAFYEAASDTITFIGGAVFHHGQAEEKGETLVLDRKTGVIVQPHAQFQAGPSVENLLRRWIAAVQTHQTAEAVMSPALIQAARQQDVSTAQTLRAFGSLQSIRFVRAMPDGVSNYEADFAHGKLNLMVGPLTADGKLDQLRFGPIWAKDGERPRPGVPLAP